MEKSKQDRIDLDSAEANEAESLVGNENVKHKMPNTDSKKHNMTREEYVRRRERRPHKLY